VASAEVNGVLTAAPTVAAVGTAYSDAVAHIGLARTPRRIAELLALSAAAIVEAAAELEALSHGRATCATVAHASSRAEQASRRAADEAGEMLGGALDRSDVLAMTTSLRLLAARLEEAAAGLATGPAAREWRRPLAGVIRDVARELKGAVDHLDGPDRVRDSHLGRAGALYEEGRRILRTARAEMLATSSDPIEAIAGHTMLRHLERVLVAARQAVRAVGHVAVKHA
jgi:hypothetical protein